MLSPDRRQREFARRVVVTLREAGYQALWAGGCVRDQLLGRTPQDYDVATSALPDQVRELFGRRRTLAIGASFGVITVLGGRDLQPIEIATFRTDGQYRDGRRPERVSFTDAEHDAQRRDFTVNGLFFDPLAEQVVDYVGGVADLAARLVRAIGDPRRRFVEDKLRMLRAVRFAATLEFDLDDATLAAAAEMAPQIEQVSGERIGAELRRILRCPGRRRGLELIARAGLLAPLLPEAAGLVAAQASDADRRRWEAILTRLARLDEPTVPLSLAALLADATPVDGVAAIARRWKLTNQETTRVKWLIEQLPAARRAGELPWPTLQPLLAHPGGAELVNLLAADLDRSAESLARCRETLTQPTAVWNPPPLVTGDDLVAAGLPPGKRFAQLLGEVRAAQLLGQVTTRDEALALALRVHHAAASPAPPRSSEGRAR